MDVFHKILLKVFETSGGRENTEVDLADLVKKEGFLSNIEVIHDHLCAEGWVSATDRKNVVRITHWGVAEARRTSVDQPDLASTIEKDADRLVSSLREALIVFEEFSADPSAKKFAPVKSRLGGIADLVSKIERYYS